MTYKMDSKLIVMNKRDKFDTLVLFEKGIYLPIDDTYFYGFFFNKQKKINDYHDINLTLDEGIRKYIRRLLTYVKYRSAEAFF